jgi:predicted AlkP superfamily pyrophosphatase or phosphodiesterase
MGILKVKYASFVLFISITLALFILSFASIAQDAPKNIVLIGWDGAQREHLHQMIDRGELPNLVALSKGGALVDMDVTAGATDTKAGWSQILTGYAPEKTGVFSNSKYQPIPIGYTVFERLEKFFGPDNIVTIAIIGKKGHVDADDPSRVPFERWSNNQKKQNKKVPAKPKAGMPVANGGKLVEEGGKLYVEFPGKPYFYTKDHIDMFLNGLLKNEKVGTTAMENLEKYKDKRFFFFIHFAEPDHAGHANGENSQEYTDGIKSDDEWTGKIISKLKELGLYDKTLVYITADHGFNEDAKGHSYAPYVFLAANDSKVKRNGNRMDVTPTILKRFGVDISRIEPELDGIPMDESAPERKAPPEKPAARLR